MLKPDFLQCGAGGGEGVAAIEEFERECHVLKRRHCRHQMEGLKHDADFGGAEPRQLIFVERVEIGACDKQASLARALKTCDHHEQSGFAGTGAPHHGDGLAFGHVEIDAAQNVHRTCARRQGYMHVIELDDRGVSLLQSLVHGNKLLVCSRWHGSAE